MLRGPVHAGLTTLAAFSAALSIALTGCAHRAAAPIPAAVKIGAIETGEASWYGVPYNGRPSASGEIYDMEKLTAAHRTLPFGTWVEVTDLQNGKKVDVRVNDRGPFVKHRIIDLSLAAAREIDMVGPGTARVRLKVIEPPPAPPLAPVRTDPVPARAPVPASVPVSVPAPVPAPAPGAEFYAVQAGAFSTMERAESFAESIRGNFEETRVEWNGTVWRVLIGRALPLSDANRLAEKVKAIAGEALVVADR